VQAHVLVLTEMDDQRQANPFQSEFETHLESCSRDPVAAALVLLPIVARGRGAAVVHEVVTIYAVVVVEYKHTATWAASTLHSQSL
jgi:hypothetical protein